MNFVGFKTCNFFIKTAFSLMEVFGLVSLVSLLSQNMSSSLIGARQSGQDLLPRS